MLSIHLLQSLEVSYAFLHAALAELRVHKAYKSANLVANKREVKAFEFAEHLGCEDVVDGIGLVAAAGDIDRNEAFKLFYDTVTEGNTEFFDDIKIELFDFCKSFLAYGMLLLSAAVKLFDVRI